MLCHIYIYIERKERNSYIYSCNSDRWLRRLTAILEYKQLHWHANQGMSEEEFIALHMKINVTNKAVCIATHGNIGSVNNWSEDYCCVSNVINFLFRNPTKNTMMMMIFNEVSKITYDRHRYF